MTTPKPKARKFRIKRSPALDRAPANAASAPSPVRAVPDAPAPDAATAAPMPKAARGTPRVVEQAAPEPDKGKTGEIATPSEIAAETDIDAIRREGLTGRQLRMARRTAQKHGLAPTSDHHAVALLREKGIDPFQRSNMLQVVPNKTPVPVSKPNLPQTVPAKGKLPGPPRGAMSAADRESYIARMQRDIAKRRRRKLALLFVRLMFFVGIPTFVAGWYYYNVATPMYSTKSEFVIQQATPPAAGAGGLGGLFSGTAFATATDSIAVQSYLESRDALLRLDSDVGFKDHFRDPAVDPLQRLDAEATNEEAYKLYNRYVKLGYDPTEGIIRMEVVAASPEASLAFSEALIRYAEERVDNLTQRLREDQMAGAIASYEDAEAKMREAQLAVVALKEQTGIVDSVGVVGARLQQVSTFEVELNQKRLQLESLLANARPNAARVRGLEGDIARLEALIAELQDELTAEGAENASLARTSSQLTVAEVELQTRQAMLAQALQQLETARIEANRQTRYLSLGVEPVPPDEPTYPRAFENTILAFLIFAGIYLMFSITASILREQVSS